MNLSNNLFVDTSFFVALGHSGDINHGLALEIQTLLGSQNVHKVTSEYVLFEFEQAGFQALLRTQAP
ncbi:MAG: hypothetical protein R3A44_30590 [Caldilineaceae bacterium]